MHQGRIQLTLFLDPSSSVEIEHIRSVYNPIQYGRIAAHVTICREDELAAAPAIENLLATTRLSAFSISFGKPERFAEGKGLLIPARGSNTAFHTCRKILLNKPGYSIRSHQPHITLIHPRNGQCTNEVFDESNSWKIPNLFYFDKISLIQEVRSGEWNILNQYPLI